MNNVIRPGNPDKGIPFWNGFACRFIYPPSFEFEKVPNAVKYRYTVFDEQRKIYEFEAETPWESLAGIWVKLPRVGWITVICDGIGDAGQMVGRAGYRMFWKQAAFTGKYPPAAKSFRDSGRIALEYLLDCSSSRYFLENGRPDPAYRLNCYPSKIDSAMVVCMLKLAGIAPDRADEASRLARLCADHLIEVCEPDDAPLASLPATYSLEDFEKAPKVAIESRGQVMAIYPFEVGEALLAFHKFSDEAKYLVQAEKIGRTMLKLQLPDGSWHLRYSMKDASAIGDSIVIPPFKAFSLFDGLFDATGDVTWREAGDRALGYIKNGPLVDWAWEGQFEDTADHPKYFNLTKHNACDTLLVMQRREKLTSELKDAMLDIVRFAEDQFVCWENPYQPGVCFKDKYKRTCYYPNNLADEKWRLPAALEQYEFYIPIDASCAKLIRTFIAAFKMTGDEEYIAKAKALGDSVTRAQRPDGSIPTHMVGAWGDDPQNDWFNCMGYTALALLELSEVGI